jgi:putative ABC transport system substrate-binding protein
MTVTIGRRELLAALGGAAAWPLAARAQQPGKLPTIGYLGTTTASAWGPWTAAFVQRLDELGWTEGRTIATEYRWADGRSERFAEIATEFVLLKVDVIVTGGNAAVASKQATSVIPIVFVLGDPVGIGLIANLARPGGNITGLTNQQPDLAGKRLEILRDLVPSLRRLAIMANVDYVVNDALVVTNRVRINTWAAAARLPTMHGTRAVVEAGGLISYGPNFPHLFRRTADYVDKILRGTKPGDIPVERPTKFDLVINNTTARAIGLKIPESFLLRADEVIE